MKASDITPRAEIAVSNLWESGQGFAFYPTADAASELAPFGEVLRLKGDLYTFTIDARYSLSDIISFIESYGGK